MFAPRGLLDAMCPIEWSHPLNRGLVGCWMDPGDALPGWRGGNVLHDLVRGALTPHNGTLTNGPTWQPGGRSGGYGSLSLASASSQYVRLASTVLSSGPPLTVTGWVRKGSTGQYGILVSTHGAFLNNGWRVGIDGATERLTFTLGGVGDYVSGITVPLSSWAFVAVTVTGSGGTVNRYVGSGGSLQSDSGAVGTMTGSPNETLLGVRGDFNSLTYFNGLLDDVRVYNRALSAGEVRALYDQSCRGHPDTMRWLPTPAYLFLCPHISDVGEATWEYSTRTEVAGYNLVESLTAYWGLGEASGDALDSHWNNHHLTAVNAPGSAAGKVGNARDLESGSSQYFTIPDSSSISTGDIDYTFSSWVKLESKSANQAIVSQWGASGQHAYVFYYDSSSDRFVFLCRKSDGSAIGTVTANNLGSPSTGTWYHLVAWHDSVNNVMGVAGNAGTADTVSTTAAAIDSNAAFCIGATIESGTPSNYFDGLIDEVALWKNRVLTSNERTWLYNSGSGRSYADINPAGSYRKYQIAKAVWEYTTRTADAAGGGDTFTATAAVSMGAMTAAGSATFAAGTKTATAAVSAAAQTAAGSAQFTAPTYTATAAVSTSTVTAAGSATFSAGTKTASAAVTASQQTAAGSATFSPGTKTASAAVTISVQTVSASATFSSGTKTATAAVSTTSQTVAGSATNTNPVYTATAAVTNSAITAAGVGLFAAEVYSGNAAVSTTKITVSASGTTSAPVYTGTAAATITKQTAAGSGTVVNPTYTASAAVSVSAKTASGSAQFAAEIYSGTAAVTNSTMVGAGTGTTSVPVYTGTAALSISSMTGVASATFSDPVYSGTAAVVISALLGSGSAVHTEPGACDYPTVGNVRAGVVYGYGAYTGTLVLPDEEDVRLGIQYGAGGIEFTGTLTEGVIPTPGSNMLYHSPADIIRHLLIKFSYGVLPPTEPWPTYAANEPDSPDNCITVYDTAGTDQGRGMTDGERTEHHGVQVRVRASSHEGGYVKAGAIRVAMDEVFYQESVTIDGRTYYIHSLNRTSDVLALGREAPNSRRALFTVNALAVIRSVD